MDKGIRNGVNVKFAEMLPQLKELGGKKFRRIILDWTVEQYGVTMASASTHYNFSLHAAKVATPALVEGLGRPEGKNNGGRKKKEAAEVVVAADPEALALEAGETVPVQTVFTVRKKKDDSMVAENLNFEDAKAMIEAAALQKKAKLYYV